MNGQRRTRTEAQQLISSLLGDQTAKTVELRDATLKIASVNSKSDTPPPPPHHQISSDNPLKNSEALRVAQVRILELENEVEKVRQSYEDLVIASDTLKKLVEDLNAKFEKTNSQLNSDKQLYSEEKKILKEQLISKEKENSELKQKIDENEARIAQNFQKIRVRERELEHRLEIIKLENSTLINAKDKSILEYKKQIDQLHFEADQAKNRVQEANEQLKNRQETVRRVVRALRIALTILEGDESGTDLGNKDSA